MNKDARHRFTGIYRGVVRANVDPEQRGRLMLDIPDVLGLSPSTWAEPCVPLAGPTGSPMGVHLVPPVGAGVWVQFEYGDVDRPIWMGCRWGQSSDLPQQAKLGNPASPNIVIQTAGQHSLTISDVPPTPKGGGIVLRSAGGATIVVNDSGIYVDNGQGATITLSASTIQFNKDALLIT